MKKIIMLGLVFAVMFGICSVQTVNAANTDNSVVKEAIQKYKDKNYIGCISDLKQYTEKASATAVAWYYLGSSYMNIAMQQEAYEAYDKVIALNSVPKLTSYAIQAELCMQDKENCKYKDFTTDEIKQLKANPMEFLKEYAAKQVPQGKDPQTEDIEKLIKGMYPNNMNPKVMEFIQQERTKIRQNQINSK